MIPDMNIAMYLSLMVPKLLGIKLYLLHKSQIK